MKFKLLAGVALAAVFAASAASAEETGWYGAADLGYHMPWRLEGKSTNPNSFGSPYIWNFQQDKDYTAFARLGYRVADHWRVELEMGYRPGDLTSVRGGNTQSITGLCTPGVLRTAAAPACGAPTGKIEAWSGLFNVIYDIGPNWVVNPFIGAGVGVQHLALTTDGQFSNVTGTVTPQNGTNPAIQNLHIDDAQVVFAWQVLAGLSYKYSDRLNIDATYRYENTSNGTFTSVGTNALQPGDFHGRYRDNSVTVGLR